MSESITDVNQAVCSKLKCIDQITDKYNIKLKLKPVQQAQSIAGEYREVPNNKLVESLQAQKLLRLISKSNIKNLPK